MRNFKVLISFTAVGILVNSICFSQCLWPKFSLEPPNDFSFGYQVAMGGDFNNDGFVDFIVGQPGNCTALRCAGRAHVFSGQDASLLLIFDGEAEADFFGHSVASAGDVDSDGYDDIIVGAIQNFEVGANPGRAYVFSGQTGDTLYVFTGEASNDHLGKSVASAGDVNKDGFSDFIIGAWGNDISGEDAGRAYVFSGQSGDTLYTFTGESDFDHLGWSVSTAGDVNADDYADIIIGAPLNDGAGLVAGRAFVFSGQTGDTLYVLSGEAAGDYFGFSVALAGDVNNDGYSDVIVGAYANDHEGSSAGRAYVYSGQTGETLHVFSGAATGDAFGISVASAGDVNNDGYDDLIIGATLNDESGIDAGKVYVFSGQSGAMLHSYRTRWFNDNFGNSVAGAGDVDNDGFDDIIIAAIGQSYNGYGQVYVSSSCCQVIRGDANGDGFEANILDLNYVVNRIFRGGPASLCPAEGDANSDCTHSILDLNFLVNRIFRGGPMPGPC